MKLCKVVPFGANGDVQISVADEEAAYRKTAYRDTALELLRKTPDFAVFAIPAKVKRQDFDPLFLVEHIRLYGDSQLARKPIIIYPVGEAPQHRPATDKEEELYYSKWGVSWTDFGLEKIPASDFPEEVGQVELEGYIEKHALKPRFTSGSHDKANLWGPYALLLALCRVDDSFSPTKDYIANKLSEDTYYLKKVLSYRKQIVPQGDIAQLKRSILQLKNLLTELGRKTDVLIVEDQLDDGWRDAYDCLATAIGLDNGFKYAATVDEAKKQSPSNLDAIVLDVRLQPALDAHADQVFSDMSSDLSGVALAKGIRERCPSVPILAATASNKVWTLESLAQHGVNAYWVKESPVTSTSERHCVMSTTALLDKLYAVLSWSESVRPRVDRAFEISKVVSRHKKSVAEALKSKALLLAAHEFQGFDSMRRGVNEELHLDISYMLFYSMINEFYSWLVLFDRTKDGKGILKGKGILTGPNHNDLAWKISEFNEGVFFDLALKWVGLKVRNDFGDKVKLRNKLPLVHGRMLDKGRNSFRHATSKDVDELAKMLLAFVKELDKPQSHSPVST